MEFGHKPIMLEACIAFLVIRPDGTYVDMTLGGAGHAAEILKRLGEDGLLIGIDQDENAILAAGEKLASVLTVDYLRKEAAMGRREDFDRFLSAVPDGADETDTV